MADRFRFDRFELRRVERQLLIDGVSVRIGSRAVDLLLALVDRRDRVVAKSELLDLVWPGLVVEEANVQVQVSALRKLLGPDVIATVGGIGYRLATPVEVLGLAPHHNLPAQRTEFVGREAILKEARQLLKTTRLLTLVGIGGIGKTRLAVKLAESVLSEHRHGARWVDLAPLSTAEQVETALAEAVGCQLQGGGGAFVGIATHCRDFEFLLVLDNCEHLLDAVVVATDILLAAVPGLRIVLTSREGLGAVGEQLLPVRPLDLPMPDAPAAAVVESEAVQLFIDRARGSIPDLAVHDDDLPLLAEICRRLDGVPLALELAAARLRLVSTTQLLALLDQRFELLTRRSRASPRQSSLQAMIRWSYEAARPQAQQTLCAIAVCAGGCDFEALKSLRLPAVSAASVTASVAQLLDMGLIAVDHHGSQPRFSMLETVGQYAIDRLRKRGQLDTLRRRHRDYFLLLAETADWHRTGALDREASDRMRAESDNLVRAMSACDAPDDATFGLRFVVAMRGYWASRGQLRQGRDLTTVALARDGARRPDSWRSAACRALAQLHWWLGEVEQATGPGEEALAIAEHLNDMRLMGQACRTLSYVYGLLDRRDAAGHCAQEALRLARRLGDAIDLVAALGAVADHMARSGEWVRAEKLHEEAYRVRKEHGDLEGQGSAALAMADIAIELGALNRARKWLRVAARLEALTQSRHIGQHLVERGATLAAHAGQPALAIRWFSSSARHRRSTGLSDLTLSLSQRAGALQRASAELDIVAISKAERDGLALGYAQMTRQVKEWLATGVADGPG